MKDLASGPAPKEQACVSGRTVVWREGANEVRYAVVGAGHGDSLTGRIARSPVIVRDLVVGLGGGLIAWTDAPGGEGGPARSPTAHIVVVDPRASQIPRAVPLSDWWKGAPPGRQMNPAIGTDAIVWTQGPPDPRAGEAIVTPQEWEARSRERWNIWGFTFYRAH